MPVNNWGKPRWWCHSWLIHNIWATWANTCGCIFRHSSNTLLCVTACENKKKSVKTSGRHLWTPIGLVHLKFPDAWRCSVHLFKQLYATINSMRMPDTILLRKDMGSMSQMNVLRCEMGIWTSEQKEKLIAKILLKLVRESSSTVKLVLYRHGLKGHLTRKKQTLLQKQY